MNTAYGSSAAGKSSSGDVYASHDGNVYKNEGSGWQTYDDSTGSWFSVPSSAQQQAQATQQQRAASGQPTVSSAQQQAQATQQQLAASGQPTFSSAQASAQERAGSSQVVAAARSSGSFNPQELNQEMQNRQRGAYQSQRFQEGQAASRGTGGRRARPLGRAGTVTSVPIAETCR